MATATVVEQELIALKELPFINLSDPCVDKQISCEEDHVVEIRLKDRVWRDSELWMSLKKLRLWEDFVKISLYERFSAKVVTYGFLVQRE